MQGFESAEMEGLDSAEMEGFDLIAEAMYFVVLL